MSEELKVLVPAVLALVGTAITVYFGYRQWKGQQKSTVETPLRASRQQAYEELWQKLEEVHILLRTETVDDESFQKLRLAVNSQILKSSLYLDEIDRELANEYIQTVRRYVQLLKDSKEKTVLEIIATTGPIPPATLADGRELVRLQNKFTKLRSELIERFRGRIRE